MTATPPRARPTLADRAAFALATVGGSGLSPFAPGTAGTLATVPLWWLLATHASPLAYAGATLLLLALGIPAAARTASRSGLKDPGIVVVDEAVGFLVTMTFIEPTLQAAVLGFLVFRALDVLKPMGIERLEALPGGFGIMMDDFAAGVVGNVIVRLALWLVALAAAGAPA